MEKLFSLIAGTLFLCLFVPNVHAEISVIPQPAEVKGRGNKTLSFDATFFIDFSKCESSKPEEIAKTGKLANIAVSTIRTWTGLRLDVQKVYQKPFSAIRFKIDSKDEKILALGKEGYRLTITPESAGKFASKAAGAADYTNVLIESSGDAGAFYGLQTLVQLFKNNGDGTWSLPVAEITDSPRFAWRGLMLDEARYFFGKDAVKQLLDVMAMHKMNVLHWHLTDDQGWRIEIKKYPKLTAVGAERAESPVPGNRAKGDGMPYGGGKFYTQEELREIVAYAAERHITIVPEIEVPGHSAAALAAYPEFGCTDFAGYNPKTETRWGIFDYLYAPKPETMQFLRDVFDEVCAIFPSEYIHVGGDEAAKKQWKNSKYVQKFIAENNLKNENGLQSRFIGEVEKHLNSKGRRIVGWDEIVEGGVTKTATVMAWRNMKEAKHALELGNEVVIASKTHFYLNCGQGAVPKDAAGEPYPKYEYNGHIVPLETVYSFEPISAGIAPELEKKIIGVQACAWSPYFFDWSKACYMIFPRALAVSEIAWSPKEKKDFKNFEKRLEKDLKRLDTLKINYRRPDGSPAQP